jgi:hypothetical protein
MTTGHSLYFVVVFDKMADAKKICPDERRQGDYFQWGDF